MRVAHVFPTDRVAYLMRARLMRLQEHGIEVAVVCGDRGYVERLRDCKLEVQPIPFAREIAPWTDMRCVWALRNALRAGSFDIMHSHNPKGTLLGPFTAQWANVPLVVHTVHGLLFNENSHGLHRTAAVLAERWCAHWSDHLLFQSEADYDYAVKARFKKPDRLHWIGNGVDERRFNPADYPHARRQTREALGFGEDALVVGMVTRLVREKGCVDFLRWLRAWQSATAALNSSWLASQSGKSSRMQLTRSQWPVSMVWKIAACCWKIGWICPNSIWAWICAFLPSYREGLPRCLLEAATMGIAVAATDIRGCREVIVDGETGLLFPLKDVEGFIAVIERVLADDELRMKLAQAGQLRVRERYLESLVTERIVGLYESGIGA